jgi:hypothetical protein
VYWQLNSSVFGVQQFIELWGAGDKRSKYDKEGIFVKQKGNFRYMGISYLLVLLVVFCLISSCSAVSDSPPEEEPAEEEQKEEEKTQVKVIEIIDENSIQKPTWKIGDRWCMGYTIDFSEMEDEMRSDFDSAMGKIKRLDVRGEIGMYQSAEVVKDDVVEKIDGTDYICYKVHFEQYMGGAFTMDYDIEMEIPDYSSYEDRKNEIIHIYEIKE